MMKLVHDAMVRQGLLYGAAVIALAAPHLAYAQDAGAAVTPQPADDPAATEPADSQDAAAQQEPEAPNEGDELVVTALRRNALLSEVPLSISVVSAETLERDNITNIVQLNGRLPSLVIGQSFGGSRVAIRGIGFNPIRPGDEGRVAFYSDGVYVARPSAQIGTLFDVERIEVLRGPQGTLYGRNATGGALLVNTREPTDTPSGYLNATVGSYDLYQFSGALSYPISDTFSARLAFQTVNRDGYDVNQTTGNDVGGARTAGFRLTTLWEPSDRFRLKVSADSYTEDDNNYVIHPIRPGVSQDQYRSLFGTRDVAQAFDPDNEVDSHGVTVNASFDLTDQLTLSAVGGYRNFESRLLVVGGGQRDFAALSFFGDDSEQYTADLQLTGDFGRLSGIVGVSYLYEDQNPFLRSAIVGRAFFAGAPNRPVQGTWSTANLITDTWAVFGELTFDITEELSVTAGLRYSKETKESLDEISAIDLFSPYDGPNAVNFGFRNDIALRPGFPRDSRAEFDALTPKIAINYEFTPDISAYATYVEGFKSGGFNYGTIQDPYQPETIANYELGFRASLADRAVTLRGALFSYDYQRLQQTVQQQFPPGTFVLNTGDATIQGAELEFILRPVPAFQIDGNVAVLDTELGDFTTVNPSFGTVVNIGGNRVPQAPEYTLYLGAQYTAELPQGSLTLRGDYRRTGKTYFDIYQTEAVAQDEYDVVGANLTFETSDEQWRATLFVQNIGDTYAANQLSLQVPQLGGLVAGTLIPPRTYGLTVGYSF